MKCPVKYGCSYTTQYSAIIVLGFIITSAEFQKFSLRVGCMEVAQKLCDTRDKLNSCTRLHAKQYQTIWISQNERICN